MTRIQDIPIKQKLTRVMLMSSIAMLLVVFIALAGYEWIDFRRAMARDMTVLADILAKNNKAALAFGDSDAARDSLLALQSEPQVMAAALYDENNLRLADYTREHASVAFPIKVQISDATYAKNRLIICRPVHLNGRQIGAIYIQSDLVGLYHRLYVFAGIAGLILLCALGITTFISAWLQRPILVPILELTKTTQSIARNNDYSIRAPACGKDEVGLLTNTFNLLLDGIAKREKALQSSNDALQSEILERQLVEDKVKSQLIKLSLLNSITHAIGERQDMDSIMQVVIRSLEDDLPVDFGCICQYEKAAGTLSVIKIGMHSRSIAKLMDLSEQSIIATDDEGLSNCVSGNLIYLPNSGIIPQPFAQRLTSGGLGSAVMVPMQIEGKVFAILIAGRKASAAFTSDDCEFLRQLGSHVSLSAHQTKLYAALQEAYQDLRDTQQAVMQQERLRVMGQMASGVAHDINNAISPVALYTEMLLTREANLSDRAREYLVTISHAIEDVAQTVARMREFYREREENLRMLPVDLNSLAKEVLDLTRVRWSDMVLESGVVVTSALELDVDLPLIQGIESEIKDSIINLVFNAVDAMPRGGKLVLRTRKVESTKDDSGVVHPIKVQIEVSDTGIGMDESTRLRCLEPFFTTKGERGTGLGLAMVYGMVQRLGAEIDIDSAPGVGTTIRISYPASLAIQNESISSLSEPQEVTPLRILVIDDDPILLKSLQESLLLDGHTVDAADGGKAGIEAFTQSMDKGTPFEIVFTDLGMPHVDGRKVVLTIKEMSPSTPVVLLTGWGKRLAADGDVPVNVDCILGKPPKLRELREAISTLVPKRDSGRDARVST